MPDVVEVVVRVTVLQGDDPEEAARAMIVDALAARSRGWLAQTFVSQSDVKVRRCA